MRVHPRPRPTSPVLEDGARCWSCGRGASTAAQRADLATTWLVPGPQGSPVGRSFCRGCAPGGAVDEVTCARCGDGPLLAGELTAMNLVVSAAVDAWLAAAGWRLAGPVCPACAVEVVR